MNIGERGRKYHLGRLETIKKRYSEGSRPSRGHKDSNKSNACIEVKHLVRKEVIKLIKLTMIKLDPKRVYGGSYSEESP